MRICVVGNSHGAALKLALGPASRLGPHAIDFFLVRGGAGPRLSAAEGRLLPAGDNPRIVTTLPDAAARGVEIGAFDAFVITACGWHAARNSFIDRDARSHPLNLVSRAEWAEGEDRAAEPPASVSAAVFEALVAAYVRDHGSIATAALIAAHSAAPILLQPWPAPSGVLKSSADWFVNVRHGGGGPRAWRDFFASQYAALAAAASELGPGAALLDYPAEAAADDGFMAPEWCSPDPWHANERYGALVLKQIERRLDEHGPGRPAKTLAKGGGDALAV